MARPSNSSTEILSFIQETLSSSAIITNLTPRKQRLTKASRQENSLLFPPQQLPSQKLLTPYQLVKESLSTTPRKFSLRSMRRNAINSVLPLSRMNSLRASKKPLTPLDEKVAFTVAEEVRSNYKTTPYTTRRIVSLITITSQKGKQLIRESQVKRIAMYDVKLKERTPMSKP